VRFFVNRYYEKYEKRKTDGKNGKRQKTEIVYVGEYYRKAIGDGRWKVLKAIYPVLFLLFCAVYIFAVTRKTGSSYSKYVALTAICAVIPAYFVLTGIVYSIVAKREMTLRNYRLSVLRVKYGSIALTAFMALTTAFEIVFIYLNEADTMEWFALAGYVGCTVLSGAVFVLEWRTRAVEIIQPANK